MSTPLEGQELLAKVKDMGDASKSELVIGTGWTSVKKDGSVRLNYTGFYAALLEAKGMKFLDRKGAEADKGGRKLEFVARVQGNGNLLVGKAYTRMLDLEPGDEFALVLNRRFKTIRLVPVNGPGYPDGGEAADSATAQEAPATPACVMPAAAAA